MSDWSDDEIFELDPDPGFWRTRDGRTIAMVDMTNDHLSATAMLERNNSRHSLKYNELIDERSRRAKERATLGLIR